MQIPDAPWIRHAELYGVDERPTVKCPWCEEECETLYIDQNGDVAGCEHCVDTVDAYDWMNEHREDDREEYDEE